MCCERGANLKAEDEQCADSMHDIMPIADQVAGFLPPSGRDGHVINHVVA
jgi:hypothetical protein